MSEEIGRLSGSKNVRESLLVSAEAADQNKHEIYEFGPFRLEPAERKLLRGCEVVALTPKVFDMLVMLVRNNGHLLDKDDLIRSLWPDSFVEEGNLSNNIFVLRKALGNDRDYIETVPRRGYRFVGGAVRPLPGAEKLPSERREFGSARPADRRPVEPVPVGALTTVPRPRRRLAMIAGTTLVILAIGAADWWRNSPRLPDRSQWVQLTKFPDSVTQPALSPDGRMVVFIPGYSTFVGPGQIYVKILPDGQQVQLTHDDRLKMSPAFSPDGSRIAYTTVDNQFHWDTEMVPTLGGEPQPLLQNASGLIWTGPAQVLFSEIKTGVYMGIVAAQETGLERGTFIVPKPNPLWPTVPTCRPMVRPRRSAFPFHFCQPAGPLFDAFPQQIVGVLHRSLAQDRGGVPGHPQIAVLPVAGAPRFRHRFLQQPGSHLQHDQLGLQLLQRALRHRHFFPLQPQPHLPAQILLAALNGLGQTHPFHGTQQQQADRQAGSYRGAPIITTVQAGEVFIPQQGLPVLRQVPVPTVTSDLIEIDRLGGKQLVLR